MGKGEPIKVVNTYPQFASLLTKLSNEWQVTHEPLDDLDHLTCAHFMEGLIYTERTTASEAMYEKLFPDKYKIKYICQS